MNTDLLRDPGLLQRSPYDKGWILCIKSLDISAGMRDLLSYEAYLACLNRVRSSLSVYLDPAGNLAWQTAFGDHLSVTDWKACRSKLFPCNMQVGSPNRRN